MLYAFRGCFQRIEVRFDVKTLVTCTCNSSKCVTEECVAAERSELCRFVRSHSRKRCCLFKVRTESLLLFGARWRLKGHVTIDWVPEYKAVLSLRDPVKLSCVQKLHWCHQSTFSSYLLGEDEDVQSAPPPRLPSCFGFTYYYYYF